MFETNLEALAKQIRKCLSLPASWAQQVRAISTLYGSLPAPLSEPVDEVACRVCGILGLEEKVGGDC